MNKTSSCTVSNVTLLIKEKSISTATATRLVIPTSKLYRWATSKMDLEELLPPWLPETSRRETSCTTATTSSSGTVKIRVCVFLRIFAELLPGVDCCACGFEGCRGKAWGYKFLSEDVQEKLKPKLSITVLMQMKKLGKINEDEFDSILAQGRATVKASVK